MNAIHAGITKGVSELLESPTRILKRAEAANKPGAILNHNKPVGYIVSRSMIMDSGLEEKRVLCAMRATWLADRAQHMYIKGASNHGSFATHL